MSHNQSRAERSESTQYRKTGGSGISNQQRNFPAGGSTKGGGGASFAPSNSGSRSFKKYNNSNGQGGQSWERSHTVGFEPAARDVQNYPHPHQSSKRVNDVPVTSATSNVKLTIAPQDISGAIPSGPSSNVPITAPTSNVPAVNSESGVPTTPAKGDASKSFPLQFGSIIPGLMNGVQVPARTSSAPPNLDEQKKDQVRREPLRAPPTIPIPSIPKHHLQKKDDQNNPGESQSVSKSKKEPQNTALPPPVTQSQKPTVHPIPNMPMQLPYHQPQIPLQYGGPNPHIQSQAMSATSLPLPMQMQMPLPLGNPQMQQPMFISGLQPHPLQSQGMMHHQGQNFNFSSSMNHQLPPQMGNMGINLGGPPQFPQPQAGKYGTVPRKTVKITHPDTHEELRLDSSFGSRSHPIVQPQSQPITSFPPNHQTGFYPNSFNASSLYFPGPGSVSLNNNQVLPTSQPVRISKQVTVKQPVGPSHVEKESLPAKRSTSFGKSECKEPARLHDKGTVRPLKDVESLLPLSSLPQTKHVLETPAGSAGVARKEDVVSDAVKGTPNEAGNVGKQDQVCRLSVPTEAEAEAVKTKSALSVTDSIPESAKESLSTAVGTSSDASNSAEEKTTDISVPEIVSQSLKSIKPSLETYSNPLSLESPEITAKNAESSNQEITDEITEKSLDGDAICLSTQDDKTDTKYDEEIGPVLVSSHHEGSLKPENEDDDNSGGVVSPTLIFQDKVSTDANAAKDAAPRGKKKKKLYRKAEAAGANSDLYNAYKGPEEKKELVNSAGSIIKPTSGEVSHKNDSANEKSAPRKTEPDDWEDAAENSPQLPTSKNDNQDNDRDVSGLSTKKYSRDFLLKFMEQCTGLPEGFEITSAIDALMVSGNILRESSPSPARNIDRPGSRSDRRSSGLGDEDKWNKFPGPLVQGRGDMYVDAGYAGNNIVGFRPGQGSNYGVLRNPRTQPPIHHPGGIIAAHMHQFLGPQPPQQRNNSDSDRWQRGTGFGKGGLMPSPQPVMHKAERKYEVGKVTDEEQAKQRQLKGILNKLTPQNFEKLFQQVKEVNIDNVVTLSGVIAQIFDKALTEPTFCEMYADFCFHLATELPELSVENEKITFKRLLLNKCQEEFERGEREEEEANKAEEEGDSKQTAEEREENRLRVRRRMLGNIRLIGELYKKRMLTERIMHECINKLLGQYRNPDEENIEALCKLMSTIGEMIDHPKAKDHMDAYFDIMAQLSNNMRLSSRVRFMLKDSIDLRRNKWQQRRKVEGPKKIEEVHRDAAQERHAQSSRVARISNMGGSSTRRGPPMEFAPRGAPSMIFPGPQVGGGSFRGGPHQVRGYGFSQDTRTEERHSFENRILPQRPLGDDNITLGPQGGLVRGMGGFRGQPSPITAAGVHLAEGDGRRVGPGVNGLNSLTPERVGGYVQREDLMPRYAPDNRVLALSNYNAQERSVAFGNRELINTDQGFDTFLSTPQGGAPSSVHDVSSDKVPHEDRLREKSIATIKEFYSARDENEVVLCMKDLNTPSFYPSMISIWLADSFERKDNEREVFTNLLINLSKHQNAMISEDQLIQGFESVLSLLEDAKSDAPRAPEFLGQTFARLILENIISLSEVGRLLYEGGDSQGYLVEAGLAAEVLGSTLDTIKSEKGDSVLNEIRSSSNLQLEKFRSPDPKQSIKLVKFM